MNIKPTHQQSSVARPKPAQAEGAEAKEQGVIGAVEDFFSYSSRDADPHESFIGRLGSDIKHAAPFTAKLGGVGTAVGLAAGLALGSTVLLPLVGGVAGIMTATVIADKADNVRDMKQLAAIAGWTS